MMKRLSILILVLCSLSGLSQTTISNYYGYKTTTAVTQGSHKVDSLLYLPGVASRTPTWAGAIRYNASDSSIYYWTGYNWVKSGGTSIDSFTYATRRYVDSSVSALPTLYTANGTLSGNRTVTMGSYGLNFYKDASNYANLTSTAIDMRRGKLYLYGDNTFGQMRLRTSGFEYNAWNNVYENNDSSFTAGIYSSNEKTYNWKQAQFEANWQDGAAWKVAAYWKSNSTISGMKGWTMRHTSTDGQAEIHTDRETFTVGSSTDSALVRKPDGTIGLYPVGSGGGGASYTHTITTASTSQTLSTDYETWVFTGSSAATFTLPAITGDTGRRYFIKNRGTANLTLQRAGSDQLYTTGAVSSITLYPGDSYTIQNDSTYWIVL